MKFKKSIFLISLPFLFLCQKGDAQSSSILLIRAQPIYRKTIIRTGRSVAIKHGNKVSKGTVYEKVGDFISILPPRNSNLPKFDLTKEQHIGYQIPIASIESITYPKRFGKQLATVVGGGFLICGTFYTALSLAVGKERKDLSKAWGAKGILGLAVGVPLVLGSRKKKYKIGQDAWMIQ